MNSGWQLSGDAPTIYVRFAHKIQTTCTLKSKSLCVKFISIVFKGTVMSNISLSKKAKKRSPI